MKEDKLMSFSFLIAEIEIGKYTYITVLGKVS